MTDEQTQAPAPAVEEGIKVFVGNLSYGTTEEALKSVLKPTPTKLELVLRTSSKSATPPKSAGYAFAIYSNQADAEEAVKLNGTTLEERPLLIELARPPKPKTPRAPKAPRAEAAPVAEGEEAAAPAQKKKNNRKKGPKARPERAEDAVDGAEEATEEPKEEAAADGTDAPKRAPRKRKTPAQKRAAAAAAAVENGTAEVVPGEAGVEATATSTAKPKRAKKPKAPAAEGRIDDEQPAAATTSAPKAPKAPRAPREKRPTGPPSETMLFVANLSFDTTDESLKAAFVEAGVSVESARVVKRTIPPGLGRSKGFGFVETASNDDQKKGLALEGKEIDSRAISVKIANTLLETEEKHNDKIDEQAVEAITSGVQASAI